MSSGDRSSGQLEEGAIPRAVSDGLLCLVLVEIYEAEETMALADPKLIAFVWEETGRSGNSFRLRHQADRLRTTTMRADTRTRLGLICCETAPKFPMLLSLVVFLPRRGPTTGLHRIETPTSEQPTGHSPAPSRVSGHRKGAIYAP